MERRGIPAATIAVETLAKTVGQAMALAHGMPDYPIAMIHSDVDLARVADEKFIEAIGGAEGVRRLVDDVVGIWFNGALPSTAEGDRSRA